MKSQALALLRDALPRPRRTPRSPSGRTAGSAFESPALDPRSANAARRLAVALIYLRRYDPADSASDRALALAPTNPRTVEQKALITLARGDLGGARAIIRAVSARIDPAVLLPYLATFQDLYWVLDDAQQRQVLALPPGAFDDDRGNWGFVRAQVYHLRGDRATAVVYADSARLAFEEQSRAAPDDGQRHVFLGLALAYLGRKAEAIREGERGVALLPASRDAYTGAYIQHQLARIYLLLGEQEKALDTLEPLLAAKEPPLPEAGGGHRVSGDPAPRPVTAALLA